MEKLTGRIVARVVQVDGIRDKQVHFFIETEPGGPGKPEKRQRIEVEGEPPYQQQTLHNLLDKHCQAEGIKYQGKFIVQKENIRSSINVPRTRRKK